MNNKTQLHLQETKNANEDAFAEGKTQDLGRTQGQQFLTILPSAPLKALNFIALLVRSIMLPLRGEDLLLEINFLLLFVLPNLVAQAVFWK